jgi:hypothetical protein
MTVWRMRIVCWIPKPANTHSGYVILTAFQQQQWLHELVPVVRYTYIACRVITEVESVSCAERAKSLYTTDYVLSLRF